LAYQTLEVSSEHQAFNQIILKGRPKNRPFFYALRTMRDFKVIIIAYGYRTSFIVKAEDKAESIENAIVDRLGDSDIKWENGGFYSLTKKWITYEEVLDENTTRPIQSKKVLGVEVGTAPSSFG